MRTFLIFTFLITIYFQKLHAQNLVPNPSFEDTVACPTNLTQIQNATNWNSFRNTPDYFNTCAPNGTPSVSVPFNQWGFQFPYSGSAYAGLGCFSLSATNLREFIGGQLSQTLIIGEKYFVSFYVSAAKGTNLYPGVACNKMGMKFSTIPYNSSNPSSINNLAHIFTDSILSDTINWTKISGSLIADSAYQYLIFGNFFDDSNTSYSLFDTVQSVAYYYLDEIKISTDSSFVNSVREQFENYFRIYPIPVMEELIIELGTIGNISIFNNLGYEIYKQNNVSNSVKVNFTNFPNGLYIIHISSSKGSFFKKILKT